MITMQNHIRRYVSVTAVIDILSRKELALIDPQNWDDRNDSYFMELYKIKKQINGLYALCAAQCSETYHHWRVFTAAADGACLEINRLLLEQALKQKDNVRYGSVEYLKLREMDALEPEHLERLPFCKREGFMFEDEYRIVAWSNKPQAKVLAVPIKLDWIHKVYLNPWMPKPRAQSVTKLLKSLPGCTDLQVGRSLLIDSQRWKNAGDRVTNRKSPKPKLLL
jgi:hypothetical protein